MDCYGVYETNPIPDGYIIPDAENTVDWADKRLVRIHRLRLITDPGLPVWDVSYCHGQLRDGTLVHVQLPFSQIPRRGMYRAIVQYAKADHVYAKRLGIFEAISTLV